MSFRIISVALAASLMVASVGCSSDESAGAAHVRVVKVRDTNGMRNVFLSLLKNVEKWSKD